MTCKVCIHPAKAAIDAALVAGALSLPVLSDRYGVPTTALYRHHKGCLAAIGQADPDLLSRAEELLESAERIMLAAEGRKEYGLALAANREAAGRVEALARLRLAATLEAGSDAPGDELRRLVEAVERFTIPPPEPDEEEVPDAALIEAPAIEPSALPARMLQGAEVWP